ncbi:hypothetical protein EPN90_02140 [Patescibacteria group bacterium]|nr:MAG: hypothetical protein EPN90_02140 [Patescibacteria group bacterium]
MVCGAMSFIFSKTHVNLMLTSMPHFLRKYRPLPALFALSAVLLIAAPRVHSATFVVSGNLIKGPMEAVYYYGQNGKRFVFPNSKTYFSWYTDFSTVKTITAAELASIPIGGNVTYRPGVKLVKITTDPKVYAVAAHGVLRWVKTEEVAQTLYGLQWSKQVDDIPDTFFINYTVGADIGSISDFSPAMETLAAKDINLEKGLITSRWSPKLNSTFQLQFAGDFDASIDADVYDLDLFGTSPETISALHAKGKHVVCYTSVGTWENWRPDKDAFPPVVIGKDVAGWPGEKWLDIRRLDLLGPILKNRFDSAKAKGCDALDPDNVDGFNADSGFPLTSGDQIVFNKWIAEQAHGQGMSIGLKNNSEQVGALLPEFDWTLLESCHVQGWCEQVTPFISAGKAVFQIEYTDSSATLEGICPAAKKRGFSAFLKHRNLDAWVQRCM